MNKKIYTEALSLSIRKLSKIIKSGHLRGLESIIQENLCTTLNKYNYNVVREKPLSELGGKNLWDNSGNPRIDIVLDNNHAIELKVIRLPNKDHTSPNQRLYDIGQISSDYWRLKQAKAVTKAELGILLCGPLVMDLQTPTSIVREFHNRMFLDFTISKKYGELHKELKEPSSSMYEQRKLQLIAIKEMGFDKPFIKLPNEWFVVVKEGFAYVSIPINK
ncbi:MAG TPA: hypothetical protein DEB09_01655 [Candidatus Magasanikbacteria bacterium]|nr:hypothetical protein [Candidatus Magasanikbacteria bacterium]